MPAAAMLGYDGAMVVASDCVSFGVHVRARPGRRRPPVKSIYVVELEAVPAAELARLAKLGRVKRSEVLEAALGLALEDRDGWG